MKKTIVTFLFSILALFIHAQTYTSLGQWKEQLSYRKAVSVAVANGNVYCATRGGVFLLSITDNYLLPLSKLNGLSDIEAVKIRSNSFNKKILIVYKNTNLDIIESNGSIVNIPDIKNKSLFGNKVINNVYMENQYAYLACGFGIVVLDMEKEEIKDSYNFDPLGNAINIRDITTDNLYIYAATDDGVYRALKTSNLTIYTSWSKMTGLPAGIYNALASVNGKLYANLSKAPAFNLDEIHVYENGTWTLFNAMPSFGFACRGMKNYNNKLLITTQSVIHLYDNIALDMKQMVKFDGAGFLDCNDSDIGEDGNLWVADENYSLIKSRDFWAGESFYPKGPVSTNVYAMHMKDDDLWVVPGGLNAANANTYTTEGISIRTKDNWNILSGNQSLVSFDTIYDIVNVIVDPVNPRKAYAASFANGLIEFYDKKPVKIYNLYNSTLQAIIPGNHQAVWTYGLAFDRDNNLWIGNSGVTTPLAVKLSNGTWKSPDFTGVLNKPYVFQVLVDRSNQKWMVLPGGGGIAVYKGGANDKPSTANTKQLTVAKGNGNLPSPGVYCLAEDRSGEIWIGTDKGIGVFYNPENMFSGGNFDAQTIKIEQDGNIQLLLETETIQAIAVDDGNCKWIATAGSGVYLMSEDGTKEIRHFDSKNSPLFSNNVKCITIDRKTGDVYFGTDKGIISYRGDALEGLEYFTDVKAYPNPVKDNYDGPISIKGLVENTIIKITDISGTIVRELTSIGGQAIWDAKNFKGERVSTGVYMVFCTNQDGSQKVATKIMVIN